MSDSIRTDRLFDGSLTAGGTLYTSPSGVRTRLAILRVQFVTVPVGTYTLNLVGAGTTVRIATYINPIAQQLDRLVLDDRLSPADQLTHGAPATAVVRFWLSGTTYTG